VAGSLDRDGVQAVQLAMIEHGERCERRGDRIAIFDPLPGLSPPEVPRWRETDAGSDSAFAALYCPWIRVAGPDGQPMSVPPCGHVAGISAKRRDGSRTEAVQLGARRDLVAL
jgi:hypothetical protein